MVELVAIQMTSTPDVQENLDAVATQLAQLTPGQDRLVVLPECFARFGCRDRDQLAIAEQPQQGTIQQRLSALAREHQCYLVSGTFPMQSDDQDKFAASCLLYGPDGERIAAYQKIHLFDVSVNDSTGSYQESRFTKAGEQVVVADTPIGKIGLAVCYDVRFPGLFEAMGDIDILVLPAAFTQHTGEAHWHTLVRARAIEKQCFVVAANQTGVHANGRETFGHSVIYSPWGDTLAELGEATGMARCEVDIREREELKQNIPVQAHNRFRSHFV